MYYVCTHVLNSKWYGFESAVMLSNSKSISLQHIHLFTPTRLLQQRGLLPVITRDRKFSNKINVNHL